MAMDLIHKPSDDGWRVIGDPLVFWVLPHRARKTPVFLKFHLETQRNPDFMGTRAMTLRHFLSNPPITIGTPSEA